MSFDRDSQQNARRGSLDPEDPLARRRFVLSLQRRFQTEPNRNQACYYIVCPADAKTGVALTYALDSAHKNPNPTEKQPRFTDAESALGFAETLVKHFPQVKCWVLEKRNTGTKTLELVRAEGSEFFE